MIDPRPWRPTKFVERNGRWRASLDPSEVSPGFRIMADLVAQFYDRHLVDYARGNLLDLGCGKAPLLGIYREHTDSITTMDWAQSHGAEFVDICHDISSPLPLDDCSFDTVIMSDVLEHLPDPVVVLKEVRRILKNDGTLILNVPFFYWLHEVPYDFFRYTRFGLEKLAADSGFEVKNLVSLGGAPEVLLDLVGKMLMGRKLMGRLVPVLVLTHILARRSASFRRYSFRSSQQFPLAYGAILKRHDIR